MLEPFFNGYDSNYGELRTRCRDILQQEDSLSEIVQLVGRDSLSEDQKVRIICVGDEESVARDSGAQSSKRLEHCVYRVVLPFADCGYMSPSFV